jgi:hypothetical protein
LLSLPTGSHFATSCLVVTAYLLAADHPVVREGLRAEYPEVKVLSAGAAQPRALGEPVF